MIGFWTLFYKELLRFWKVAFQTVAAPVLTAMLYLMIFSHVLEGRVQVHGVDYGSFLIPGLVMMQILQNAFANASSSLIQAKIMGTATDFLTPPLSPLELTLGFTLGAATRGLAVGLVTAICVLPFSNMSGEAEQEYFSDGITEELAEAISAGPALQVEPL